MILAPLLRDRFVDLPDRDGRKLPAICAVTAEESPDMATFTVDRQGRKAFLAFHVSGELLDEALIRRNWWRLQSPQKLEPLFGGQDEVSSDFFGVLQFVVAGLAVRPSASRLFNVFRVDRALWLQIHLIDDDQKFMGFPPQGSARTIHVLTMSEIANACIQKRCRSMSSYRFRTVE
jgi:hypothetical protein